MLSFIKRTTMVGVLPIPHAIITRRYQPNQYTALWFSTFLWGVIFLRNQGAPVCARVLAVLPGRDRHTCSFWLRSRGACVRCREDSPVHRDCDGVTWAPGHAYTQTHRHTHARAHHLFFPPSIYIIAAEWEDGIIDPHAHTHDKGEVTCSGITLDFYNWEKSRGQLGGTDSLHAGLFALLLGLCGRW